MSIPISPSDIIRKLTHWRSPFRVFRCYWLRARHPLVLARRRKLARKLAPDQRARLDVLLQEGCGPATPDLDPALLAEVCAALRERLANQPTDPAVIRSKGKDFWTHLLDAKDLETDSPFVRLALQPAVIDMVSGYLGEVPYLAYIHVTVSRPTEVENYKSSQLWHEDYDDRKVLKLFIYCTDVADEDDGAFTYLPKPVSDRVPNSFFPKRISDEEMARHVTDKDISRMTGPAGTAFYVDTRNCYHLGSRIAPGHHRIAYMASFISFASLMAFDNEIKIKGSPSELERLVLRT